MARFSTFQIWTPGMEELLRIASKVLYFGSLDTFVILSWILNAPIRNNLVLMRRIEKKTILTKLEDSASQTWC